MPKKPFVLAQSENMALTVWGQDEGLPETTQAYIFALVQKFGVNRPFVTIERATKRLIDFLVANYEVKSATYRGAAMAIVEEGEQRLKSAVNPVQADDEGPALAKESGGRKEFESLVVGSDTLDAFLYRLKTEGRYDSPDVVIFFDNPEEFNRMIRAVDKEEFLEYPIGNYSLEQGMMGYYLLPLNISKTEKPIMDGTIYNNLVVDTDLFFDNKAFYKGQNPVGAVMPHKRGILLVGPPGNGKTTMIKSYLSNMQGRFGIIIDSSKYLDASTFKYLEYTLGSKQKVLVFEDVDSLCSSSSSRSAFLNFLDGPSDLENTLTIATTNFPWKLDDGLLQRPSRFDAIYFWGQPGPELRALFLLKWFPELKSEPERLEALAIGTDGFSGAFFKELFLLSGLRKITVEEALQELQNRKKMILQMKRGDMDSIQASIFKNNPIFEKIDFSMFLDLRASLIKAN
jgi:hypothetical protein